MTRRMVVGWKSSWTGAVSIALVMGFAACASIETTIAPLPPNQGSYSASIVGGDLGANLTGNAMFGYQTNSSGITEFVIFLWSGNVPGTNFDIVTLFRENLDLPLPGTYVIENADGGGQQEGFLAAYVFSGATAFGAFLSVSGTLTIAVSSTDSIEGTFDFAGSLDPASIGVNTDSVTVSGSFTAVPGQIPRI